MKNEPIFPCDDCLTFSICYAAVKDFLCVNNIYNIQILTDKCSLLRDYFNMNKTCYYYIISDECVFYKKFNIEKGHVILISSQNFGAGSSGKNGKIGPPGITGPNGNIGLIKIIKEGLKHER